MATLKIFLMALFFVGCSQLRGPIQSKSNEVQNFKADSFGVVFNLNDQYVNLDQVSQKYSVIIFASDTCSTCLEEVTYWKTQIRADYPSNVFFTHYLLGGYKQDILDWVQTNEVTWSVLYNSNDELYKKYCSAIITPCFLIRNNQTGETLQTYQILKKEDIERITGTWN